LENTLRDIIEGCKKDSREHQSLLYQRFSNMLFSICLRYSSDTEMAKDHLQESFILIFSKIKKYRYEGSFEGWIKKIVLNYNLEKLRKTQRLEFLSEDNYLESEELLDEDDVITENQLEYKEVINIIQNLPPQYRQVFNLYVFEELSHQDIAKTLKINIGTSKSNLARARQFLQKQINLLKTSKYE